MTQHGNGLRSYQQVARQQEGCPETPRSLIYLQIVYTLSAMVAKCQPIKPGMRASRSANWQLAWPRYSKPAPREAKLFLKTSDKTFCRGHPTLWQNLYRTCCVEFFWARVGGLSRNLHARYCAILIDHSSARSAGSFTMETLRGCEDPIFLRQYARTSSKHGERRGPKASRYRSHRRDTGHHRSFMTLHGGSWNR